MKILRRKIDRLINIYSAIFAEHVSILFVDLTFEDYTDILSFTFPNKFRVEFIAKCVYKKNTKKSNSMAKLINKYHKLCMYCGPNYLLIAVIIHLSTYDCYLLYIFSASRYYKKNPKILYKR